MSGRADEGAYCAAIANVSQALQHASEFRNHLQGVLASPAFCNSNRSQEFLRHVVELALNQEFDRLKERIIGIEIFHRNAEYDTGEDSIVRVTANEVRKRLNQFYAETHPEDFRIALVSGTYIPEFHYSASSLPERKQSKLNADASSEATSRQTEEQVPLEAQAGKIGNSPSDSEPLFARRRFASFDKVLSFLGRKSIAATVIAFLAFALGWVVHNRTSFVDRQAFGATSGDPRFSFYRELLGPMASDTQRTTEVVLSNPKIFLYRGSLEPAPSEDDGTFRFPLTPELSRQLEPGANDNQAGFPFHRLVLDSDDYTGLGEAKSLFGLGTLLEAVGRPARLGEARFLNWDQARYEHLIILGAPHMSPWIMSSLTDADFTFDHDSIQDHHPLRGQPATYMRGSQGKGLEDYGLIWMSQAPSGTRILVLAGITSTGTAGVGAFFADPDSMRPVYEQLKRMSPRGGFVSAWQVLLKIEARDKVPVKMIPIAIRTIPAAS